MIKRDFSPERDNFLNFQLLKAKHNKNNENLGPLLYRHQKLYKEINQSSVVKKVYFQEFRKRNTRFFSFLSNFSKASTLYFVYWFVDSSSQFLYLLKINRFQCHRSTQRPHLRSKLS